MHRLILAILVALALLCLVAPAFIIGARSAECSKIDRIKSDVAAWGDGTTVQVIDPEKSARFIAAFRAHPAFVGIKGVTAAVVIHPRKPAVLVVTFDDAGCAAQTWSVPVGTFAKILNPGEPI